ncbi:MAG TPA: serine protease [Pyrinomonadaceae bacterium]|nr:serine protease [Pyrinomonadaceae bacterium]
MTTAHDIPADALLPQATCAVLLDNELKGTAWLVSDEGHLLTAGHIFHGVAPSVEIQVRFLNDAPLKAHRITREYAPESGVDFAILTIDSQQGRRTPLPVSLAEMVEGRCRIQGYGKTLYEQSAGLGEFVGRHYPQDFTENAIFIVRTQETGEPGFSGAPVFSETLGAVVGIQTEATTAETGAGRDTVLAMPLFRIAQRWKYLSELPNPARRRRAQESREQYNSPKQFLEARIRGSYQLFCNFAEENADSAWEGKDKYGEVIKCYLQIYFLLCRRQRLTPDPEIVNISEGFEVDYSGGLDALVQTTASNIYTNLPSPRIIVGVSQMFRIADLLTRPESVKARKFYSAITNINKMRRTLNKRRSFDLGQLGSLRPVVVKSEEHKHFWRLGLPDLRVPTSQPLCFVPYELNLTERLKRLRSEFGSVFESTLVNTSDTIKNSQINGRLRIYPPGIGIISLRLDLEFKQEIHVEVVARIAHNIEELLFVDPLGLRQPYSDLMLDIINQLIKKLFVREGYDFEDRRWRPPMTTYRFPDARGLVPEKIIDELAWLMSLAPANFEELQYLRNRIERALTKSHWKDERVLAVAGDEVALFFVDDKPGKLSKSRRNKFPLWLSETHEIISAAAYAEQAFAEEIDKIFNHRILDDTWLPQAKGDFAYLKSLLETMLQVLRAISSISTAGGHLHRQGSGILMAFAKDVWKYGNPVNRPAMVKGMNYIADWLDEAHARRPHKDLAALRHVVSSIQSICPSLVSHSHPASRAGIFSEQEQFEQHWLDQLEEIEKILMKADSQDRTMQKLRKQLGF